MRGDVMLQQNQHCASAPTTPLADNLTQSSIGGLAASAAPPILYEAITDYSAAHDGELDVIVGDIITDVKDLGNGWTLGRRIDCASGAGVEMRPSSSSTIVVGIFPSNCVQPMLAEAVESCPYVDGATAERCPGCCVQDGRTAYQTRWTATVNCNCGGSTNDGRQPASGRFNFAEASDDDDDIDAYRLGLRSYGTAVVHSSLPRKPAAQSYFPPRQRQLMSAPGSGALRLEESGAESEDVHCGLVPAASPVLVCRGHEVTTEVNKPRMIVKPNLDRSVRPAHITTPTTSAVAAGRELCYCSPVDHESLSSRSAVPPRELALSSRCDDWSAQRAPVGSDLDDVEVTAMIGDCCTTTTRRRASTETSSHKSRSHRIVDVPLPPAPTPLDRRALSADSNCKLSLYGDDCPTSDSRCSEASGLYRDGGGGAGGGSVYPPRSVIYESGYYSRTLADSRPCRLVVSVLVGHLIGVVVFLWMFFHLGYGPMTSVAVSSTVAVMTCVLLALSRVCRCTAALAVPSLCTANGRVAFVVVAAGVLLAGPVTNVYVNMEEISRAMGCSAEQAYNQTMFLLQPFDAMMVQLNWTIGGLQQAARNISRGLKPLEDGLGLVEMDLYNGKLQLYGTRKVG